MQITLCLSQNILAPMMESPIGPHRVGQMCKNMNRRSHRATDTKWRLPDVQMGSALLWETEVLLGPQNVRI